MKISIILVNYNTKDLTRDCLNSVFEKTTGVEFEVFVVDNNSQDGSCEMIEQEFPQVKLIKNKENLGFGKANNIAIRQSRAKYVFLLNTDTILLNNAVKIFFDFMEKPENEKVGCCGGNLYNQNEIHQHSYGKFHTLKRVAFTTIGLNFIFRNYYYNKMTTQGKNEENELKEVEYITGADMFLRKSVLDEVGLFDEDFFMYFEETELSFRINKNGYKSVIIPEAKIIHLCGLSGKIPLEKFKIYKTSEFLYFEKCKSIKIKNMVKCLYLIRYFWAFKSKTDYFKKLIIIFKI